MPYLPDHERRMKLATGKSQPVNGAEINFVICDMIDSFVARHGKTYATLAEVQGALSLAAFEFQRRIVANYEDEKRVECGEVFHASAARPHGTGQQAHRVASSL